MSQDETPIPRGWTNSGDLNHRTCGGLFLRPLHDGQWAWVSTQVLPAEIRAAIGCRWVITYGYLTLDETTPRERAFAEECCECPWADIEPVLQAEYMAEYTSEWTERVETNDYDRVLLRYLQRIDRIDKLHCPSPTNDTQGDPDA